jgi:hypothetical protein
MAELTRRYIVMTMSAESPLDLGDPEAPFVLKPWKDPAALAALEAYRAHCYPELAEELAGWIAAIRGGPVVRGGVGARNEAHLRSRAGAPGRPGQRARGAGRPRPRPRGASKPARLKSARSRRKRSR